MEQPDGFTAPVCQALTGPMLWAGVPRNPGILNCMVTVAAVVGFHWLWYLPVGLAVHFVMKAITRYDPLVFPTLIRAVGDEDFYEA